MTKKCFKFQKIMNRISPQLMCEIHIKHCWSLLLAAFHLAHEWKCFQCFIHKLQPERKKEFKWHLFYFTIFMFSYPAAWHRCKLLCMQVSLMWMQQIRLEQEESLIWFHWIFKMISIPNIVSRLLNFPSLHRRRWIRICHWVLFYHKKYLVGGIRE